MTTSTPISQRGSWTASRTELAGEHILDVAENLFTRRSVAAVTMRDLAGAVGCSRATLYRYYPNKQAVLTAYVDRAARRLAATIIAIDDDDPARRLVSAITAAVNGVRGDPALSVWFAPDAAVTSSQLALLSPAIERIAADFLAGLGPTPDADQFPDRARYLVRIIVSLLVTPEADAERERDLLERFVVPAVLD